MSIVAFVLSLLIAAVGAVGVASPPRLLTLVRRIQTPRGLYLAAGLRLVLGAALVLAAPDSRAPGVVRVLGVIIFVGGLVTPLFGLERFRKVLDWWSARGPGFVRAWAVLALVFGLLLAYSVAP